MEQLTDIVLNALLSALVALIGLTVSALRKWLQAKAGLAGVRIVEILADNVVRAVEQMAKDTEIKGESKLVNAKTALTEALKAHNISLSDAQMTAAIESAVKSMNDGWKKGA